MQGMQVLCVRAGGNGWPWMEEKALWIVRLECAACKAGHSVKVCVCGVMMVLAVMALAFIILHMAAALL